MSYFKLTDETINVYGVTLYRIQALIDLPEHGVSDMVLKFDKFFNVDVALNGL